MLKLDANGREAPLLSVFGGKITTYRRLAEAALPGRDLPWDGAPALGVALRGRYPFLDARLAWRYRTRAAAMPGDARSMADPGRNSGTGLTACAVDWQMREEWARGPADILQPTLCLDAAGLAAPAAHMAAPRVPARRAAE